jgi:hypothetical protein
MSKLLVMEGKKPVLKTLKKPSSKKAATKVVKKATQPSKDQVSRKVTKPATKSKKKGK